MNAELQELIRDARKDLRKASGLPLTPEEENEDLRKAALDELENFILRQMGVRLTMLLNIRVAWIENGPAVTFDAEGQVFRMRKDNCSYILRVLDGGGEREIARIEGSDPNFTSRVLVAMDDAFPSKE
jgi:hypothetical protein